MDYETFTNKMTGQWVTQRTTYSLLHASTSCQTCSNQVHWKYIKKSDKYINLLRPTIGTQYILDNIHLYHIK